MNPRLSMLMEVKNEPSTACKETKSFSIPVNPVSHFGHLTFSRSVIERMLPKEVAKNIIQASEGKEKINPLYCYTIAKAMKDWAVNLGATHFCHWFQPLTGTIAEKHDAFIDWGSKGQIIEKFSGKQLFRGEPDASSFPSGGLRQTASARGYTCWDPSSFPFIWKMDNHALLCIPSVFFSWKGEVLDMKIPLLRSEEKINQAVSRLLRVLGMNVSSVFPTVGCEQEYFLVDKKLYSLRPDLILCGRTLFGAASPKTQDFEDHYFGCIQDRVICFMRDFEETAVSLGIPLKTRHSEVAPQQFEIAPIFERSSHAVDHNLLLMQIMKHTAKKHGLACLFHEKPFAGMNGSGKHCNWSLATDAGVNLLDPSLVADYPLVFLSLVVAILSAVHQHAALLRASIASPGNDHRLGGHEAPPALISVFLGEELEKFLNAVENEQEYFYYAEGKFDLRIPALPELLLDTMDRNRTSPFAYTGSKFEFRSVGASAHCSTPVMTLNCIVAESVHHVVDEIEKLLLDNVPLKQAALQVIKRQMECSRPIRFLGDNYSSEWKEEAEKRGLPNLQRSFHSYGKLIEDAAEKAFEGVLSLQERKARVSVLVHQYAKTIEVEAKLMIELFQTQILPAAFEYKKKLAKNLHLLEQVEIPYTGKQKEWLGHLSSLIQLSIERAEELKKELERAKSLELIAQASVYCDIITNKMVLLRKTVDDLENMVQDSLWPLPKYRELLFLI
jgi:glutamine synthetase